MKCRRGFTLVELLTVIAVLAITLVLAVPAIQQITAKQRLSGAAEAAYNNIKLLRAEAVRHNHAAYVHFAGTGTSWSYGLDDTADCDPTVAGDCRVDNVERLVLSREHPGVALSQTFAGSSTGFEPRRGTALSTGTLSFTNAAGELRVMISALGMIRLCTPNGSQAVVGYPDC